jgi:hypothetical protein
VGSEDRGRNYLGISRRDLLRRSAILGGALVWVTPAIHSIAGSAYTHDPSSRDTSCCACRRRPSDGDLCTEDLTMTDCEAYCGANNVESYVVAGECNPQGDCVPLR